MSEEKNKNIVTLKCRHCETENELKKDEIIHSLDEIKCKNCSKNLFLDKNERLYDIPTSVYEHPLDRDALNALKAFPGIDNILRNLLKKFSDRYFKIFFMQNYVRVNESNIKPLYKMMEKITNILDIPNIPELYILQSPIPQAFTIGVDKAIIGISTTMFDLLKEDEIEGVLAHEMAHIKSNHILYKTAARILTMLAETIASATLGIGSIITLPILYALKYWDRCSELTADRAEILITRDYDKFVRTRMKLQSGKSIFKSEFDIKEFEKQAEEVYSMEKENFMDRVMMLFQELNQTHPFPVWRVGAIREWVNDEKSYEILMGRYNESNNEGDSSSDKNESEKTQSTEQEEPKKPNDFEKFINDVKNLFGIK